MSNEAVQSLSAAAQTLHRLAGQSLPLAALRCVSVALLRIVERAGDTNVSDLLPPLEPWAQFCFAFGHARTASGQTLPTAATPSLWFLESSLKNIMNTALQPSQCRATLQQVLVQPEAVGLAVTAAQAWGDSGLHELLQYGVARDFVLREHVHSQRLLTVCTRGLGACCVRP